MLVAIIEYELNEGAHLEFEAEITRLLPRLSGIDGFISADPATSLVTPGRHYEISVWRDAAALARWTNDSEHARAKALGRRKLLKWYRIRIAEVFRDWHFGPLPADLAAAPVAATA